MGAATPLIRFTFTSVYVHVNGIAHFFGFVNFFSLQSTLGRFQAFRRGGEVPKEEFRDFTVELDTLFG